MEADPVGGRRAVEYPRGFSARELFPGREHEHLALGLRQGGERVEDARLSRRQLPRLRQPGGDALGDRLLAPGRTPLAQQDVARDRVQPRQRASLVDVVEPAPGDEERLGDHVGRVVPRRAPQRIRENRRRVRFAHAAKAGLPVDSACHLPTYDGKVAAVSVA
jgi:hypothetical protein